MRTILVAILAVGVASAQVYRISTFAGGVPPPTPIAGTQAFIGPPQGIAADSSGNVYFTALNCVFKLDANGVITRVAGNSRGDYSGDGGPATSAELFAPQGLAVDVSGNLYIADQRNGRIRKASAATGIITTVAGGGSNGLGDGGPATSAGLYNPVGAAMDGNGNLYIDDLSDNRIRKVSPAGVISTFADNGYPGSPGFSGDGGPAASAQLFDPQGVAVDVSGNVYIADTYNNRIRMVSAATGIISTIAGSGSGGFSGDGGPATSAQLLAPQGVAIDAGGNVYFVDYQNNRIRKISAAGIITTVAGTGAIGYSGDGGPASGASLNRPQGVAVDATGNLYIADSGNLRIRRVSAAGSIATVAGGGPVGYAGDGGPATNAPVNGPQGVALDISGNLYIAETGSNCIRKVSAMGVITTVAGNGSQGYSGDGGPATSAQLNGPVDVAVDISGNLYIADFNNFGVRKVSVSGVITTVAGSGVYGYSGDGGPATSARLTYASGVAVDPSGNLYVADYWNNRIRKVSSLGIITTIAGGGANGLGDGGPATDAQLLNPEGLALDATGNLYIADYLNNRIRKVSTSGIITTVAGGGTNGLGGSTNGLGEGGPATGAKLGDPSDVAVDSGGNLYIADYRASRVLKVSAAGIITTIAGAGSQGYSGDGDGGPATRWSLYLPYGVALDASGNVYIGDSGNNAVRLLAASRTKREPARGGAH